LTFADTASDVAAMKAGEWYSIAGSAWLSSDTFATACGGTSLGLGSIFEYSGGAFAKDKNLLYVNGGGHGSSQDNGIYAFNLDVGNSNSYNWSLVQHRSDETMLGQAFSCSYDCSGGYTQDGYPIANHTMQLFAYNPVRNSIDFPMQGSASTQDTCYSSFNHLRFNRYDLGSSAWQTNLSPNLSTYSPANYYGVSLVDSYGNMWVFDTGINPPTGTHLYEFKYGDNTLHQFPGDIAIYGWQVSGAIDTSRNIALIAGNGYIGIWDLSNEAAPIKLTSTVTGDQGVKTSGAAGIAFDDNTGLFVAWVGSAGHASSVYTIYVDPDRGIYHCREMAASSTNVVTPTTKLSQADPNFGPSGRWAYSSQQNLYVLTYKPEQPVLLYKLTSVTSDITPPQVTSFTLTTPYDTNLDVPITSFIATDNDRVFGYAITSSSTPPDAWGTQWTTTSPTSFTVGGSGTYSLYAWAQDMHGNISQVATPQTVEVQYLGDTTPPTLSQTTPITTPTSDATPNYTFSSSEAGTITYGGSCSSASTTAISGNNTITLNELTEGTYSNCTITVTDSSDNPSNPLSITTFAITYKRGDVDRNGTFSSSDALLSLRKSIGLSMNGTNWYSSATTGDVNCDDEVTSADSLLSLRYSLGLSMNGTAWCN
jgi:hypothetical protein